MNSPVIHSPKAASPNPAQEAAINAPGNMGVRVVAGAGTGKTYLMSHRFVRLMGELADRGLQHPEERILAVTFTVKAARQMQEKIRKLLRETSGYELSPYAHISNFHGFCNHLLRQHALDLGLTPEFGILGGLEQNLLMRRMFDGIRHGDYADISMALHRAGLGGKIPADVLSLPVLTRLRNDATDPLGALIEDIQQVLKKIKTAGLSPAQFHTLAQRQTAQFSTALKNLPMNLLDSNEAYARLWSDYLAPWADNGRSFLGNEREKERFHEKRSQKVKSHDPANDEPFYQEKLSWLAKYAWDGDKPFVWFDGRKKVFLSGSGDTRFLDELTAEEMKYIDLVAGTYALYQQILQEKNFCDFDDLINRTLELFEKRPELKSQYQQHFETLIVDEFQDSNGSQLRLVQMLMKESGNLTVVGDLKQSIYAFRYAQPENMALIFQHDGREIPREDIALHTNYRSRPPILDVANRMADEIIAGQRLEACERYASLTDHPRVTWVELGKEDDGTDDLRYNEARWIAVETARLIAEGRPPREIAILVKSHRKAQDIETLLRERGIPTIKQKNRGFFSEPVVLDAMALLRLLQNPQEEMPLVRVLQKKLSPRQLRVLADYRREEKIPLLEALHRLETATVCPEIPLEVRSALLSLRETILAHKARLGQANLVSVFLDLADTLGIIDPQAPPDMQAESRMSLNILKRLLYQLIRKGSLHPSIAEILETLDHYRQDPDLELPVSEENLKENAVQIMTIHTAKGLEFPVVFAAYTEWSKPRSQAGLLNFEQQYGEKAGFGLFLGKYRGQDTLKKLAHKEIWQKPREEAEQKRLFYVAVTRAIEKLYVVRGPKTFDWTAAGQFPPDALEVLREADDPESFAARFLEVDSDTQKAAVQERLVTPEPQTLPRPNQPIIDENTAPVDNPQLLVLSFSALNTHRQCPVQYVLKYTWGLPEPPPERGSMASSMALTKGSCLHALIEKHYRLKGALDDMVVADIMAAYLPEAGDPDTLEIQREKIRATYEAFLTSAYSYHALADAGYRIETEKPLRFPLANAENVLIRGNLDLLLYQPETDTYTLVDFKTNRELKPQHLDAYFDQLLLYREGLKAVIPGCRLPDNHLELVHLTPEGLSRHIYRGATQGAKSLDAIEKRVNAIRHLEKSSPLPDRPAGTDCVGLRCPYVGVCPKA